MKINVLFSVVLTAFLATLAGCSDDSGVDNGGGSTTGLNTEPADSKKSSDYEVGKGSCSGGHLEKRAEWGDESVDFGRPVNRLYTNIPMHRGGLPRLPEE